MPHIIPIHSGEDILAKQVAKENKATLGFQILGAADDIDAMMAIDSYKQSTILVRGALLNFDEIKLKHIEAETYSADVSYVHPDKQDNQDEQESDEPQISISTTGGSQHITHSIKTLRSYPESVKDKHKQAIGVERTAKGELKIKGADVVIPTLKVTISAKIPQPSDPFAFGRNLSRRTGRTNSSTYRGFTKWELLFLGAKLTGKRREKWSLDYEFEGSETIETSDNFKIADFGPIEKEGHAHLWVEWQQAFKTVHTYDPEVGTGERQELVVEPVGVFIEQLYFDFDLSEIGLT